MIQHIEADQTGNEQATSTNSFVVMPEGSSKNAARQGVSLCMIVRNEERNLAACLEPVAPLVDEIVIVDTGSLDKTREIASRPAVDSVRSTSNSLHNGRRSLFAKRTRRSPGGRLAITLATSATRTGAPFL